MTTQRTSGRRKQAAGRCCRGRGAADHGGVRRRQTTTAVRSNGAAGFNAAQQQGRQRLQAKKGGDAEVRRHPGRRLVGPAARLLRLHVGLLPLLHPPAGHLQDRAGRKARRGRPGPRHGRRRKVTDDGKTYTYKLRDGVTWEDGKPITSKDIKYGIERTWAQDVLSGGPGLPAADARPQGQVQGPLQGQVQGQARPEGDRDARRQDDRLPPAQGERRLRADAGACRRPRRSARTRTPSPSTA